MSMEDRVSWNFLKYYELEDIAPVLLCSSGAFGYLSESSSAIGFIPRDRGRAFSIHSCSDKVFLGPVKVGEVIVIRSAKRHVLDEGFTKVHIEADCIEIMKCILNLARACDLEVKPIVTG
ncbi:hypothetical protein NE237_021980 [Protea cynaroides]|uniref:Uncharacterized protein n=1 Tax=Protea cynaroides TaxID=273540 RepID=A0A9Q0HA53_9MAGN|nr:hypothetical protein NE237_021980 [Protea cynaroides]